MANPPADASSHNIKSANNGEKEDGSTNKDASFPSMPHLLPLASTYQSIVHQFDSSRPSIAEVLFSNADISQVEHSIDDSVLQQKIKKQQEQKKQEEQRQRDSSKGKNKKNHDTTDIKNKKDVSSNTVERKSKSQCNSSLYPQQPILPSSSNNYWQQQNPSSGHQQGPYSSRAAHPYSHDPYPPRSFSSYTYPPPPSSHPPSYDIYNSYSQYQQPRYNQSAYHDYRQQPQRYHPPPAPRNPYNASEEPASSTLTESFYTASAANYAVPPPMPKYDAQYEEHLQKRMRISDGPSLNTLTFPTNNTWNYTKEEEEEERARIVEEIYNEEHESLVRDVLGSSDVNDSDDSSTSYIEYTKKESSGDEPKKDGYLMRKDITIQELRNAKVIRRKKIIVKGAEKNDVVGSTGIKRYYAYNHCGNSQFNELIKNKLRKWRTCPQPEQYQLIEGIKAKIEELDPPGRFLKLVEKTEEVGTDKFRVMNNTEVHLKIKAAFMGKSRKLDLDEIRYCTGW